MLRLYELNVGLVLTNYTINYKESDKEKNEGDEVEVKK